MSVVAVLESSLGSPRVSGPVSSFQQSISASKKRCTAGNLLVSVYVEVVKRNESGAGAICAELEDTLLTSNKYGGGGRRYRCDTLPLLDVINGSNSTKTSNIIRVAVERNCQVGAKRKRTESCTLTSCARRPNLIFLPGQKGGADHFLRRMMRFVRKADVANSLGTRRLKC